MIDHTCGGENDSDQDQSRNDNGNQIDEEIRLPRRVSSAPGLQRSQGLTMDNWDASSHKSVEDQVWPSLNYICIWDSMVSLLLVQGSVLKMQILTQVYRS